MCCHTKDIYRHRKGGCVMDKGITALQGIDINSGLGISPGFSLEWWRHGVICKARAPLRVWQPQSISASFTHIWDHIGEVGAKKEIGSTFHLISPLPTDYRARGYLSLTSHFHWMLMDLIAFLGIHFEMKMTLTWGVRGSKGKSDFGFWKA